MPKLRRGGPAIGQSRKGNQKKRGGPDLSFPPTAAAQAEKDSAAAAKKARLQVLVAKAPPRKPDWQDQGFYTSQRVTIAHLFRTVLNWPAKEDWKSSRVAGDPNRWSLGAIRQCCVIMGLDAAVYSYRRNVQAVFIAFLAACAAGAVYDGQLKRNLRPDKQCVPLESLECQMVADCMEDGFGIKNTTMMVNAHRLENGLEHVGESAVYNGYNRMLPKVSKIQKHAQSAGPEWERANWCAAWQKGVRFGLDMPADKQYQPWGDDETTPEWASREKMEEVKCTVVQGQILAADEVHVKVR
jgi:hypothetical protein